MKPLWWWEKSRYLRMGGAWGRPRQGRAFGAPAALLPCRWPPGRPSPTN